MGFWSKTDWKIKLQHGGQALHAVRIELHDLASAFDEEPHWQAVTLTGPPGVALEPKSVTCPGTTLMLGEGKEWHYDETSRTITVNLGALSGLRDINPVPVCIALEQHNALTLDEGYSCYWVGFQSRVGGPVTTIVELPPYGNLLSVVWARLVGENPGDGGVFSMPDSTGRSLGKSSPGTISLHSSREAPRGHFVFSRRGTGISVRRAGLYVVGALVLGVLANLLWDNLVQPMLKGLGWQL